MRVRTNSSDPALLSQTPLSQIQPSSLGPFSLRSSLPPLDPSPSDSPPSDPALFCQTLLLQTRDPGSVLLPSVPGVPASPPLDQAGAHLSLTALHNDEFLLRGGSGKDNLSVVL